MNCVPTSHLRTRWGAIVSLAASYHRASNRAMTVITFQQEDKQGLGRGTLHPTPMNYEATRVS